MSTCIGVRSPGLSIEVGLPIWTEGTVGVDEDEGNPMTIVGAGGGRDNSCPAHVDDVVLDIGVAAGGVVEDSRVTTLDG